MPEYISIIQIENTRYLVDRESYYLFCSLQESKPTEKTLRTVLKWMVEFKGAISLENHPILLVFSSERKNMTTKDEEE